MKIYLTETQKTQQRNKVSVSLRLLPEVVERLRNLAWASENPGGVNAIIEEATLAALERLEAAYKRKHGTAVPARPDAKI